MTSVSPPNAELTPTADETPAPVEPTDAVRRFLRIARGYWREERAREAWVLTAGVTFFALAMLAVQIGINKWNRYFFDALDKRDGAALTSGMFIIIGLAVLAAGAAVCLVHFRMRLQMRWRQWLTKRLIGYWLTDRRFYQLTVVGGADSNPEYRIADDTRQATEPLVDFVIGLTNAVLTALAFIGVLWFVGGSIGFTIGGTAISIPGYMVLAAVVYALIGSVATWRISRPLVQHVGDKNTAEAQLRYELTRVRESAETIAMIGGDRDEGKRLSATFGELANRWIGVIRQQARMTWIINGNGVLAPVVPLLLGAPNYLDGTLSLGALMQVAAAFVQVQVALNWLVENAIRLAEWNASAQRIGELLASLADLDAHIGEGAKDTIVLGDSPDQNLHLQQLTIAQSDGTLMIEDTDVIIAPGEKVLVKGGSGTGKSTLIRAMAGLWPWGSGTILRPANARVAFMPQRPYIPLGTLRAALEYPANETRYSDNALTDALEKCGLKHLAPRLDEEDQWSRILSGGEQQRLAFARLILDPPDIVIMDEATSALDELSQARMMDFLWTDLSSSTVLAVGHRPGLEIYHTREIMLTRVVGESFAQTEEKTYTSLSHLWRKLVGA